MQVSTHIIKAESLYDDIYRYLKLSSPVKAKKVQVIVDPCMDDYQVVIAPNSIDTANI
jgi:hypothetical protein